MERLTEEEVIIIFKNIREKHYELKVFFERLVKEQRYALAKLFKNQIEIIERLKSYEKIFAKKKKFNYD